LNVRLPPDPVDVTRNAFAEIDGWFATGGPRQRGITREMAHFPGTKFAVELGRNMNLQNVGKLFRDFANGCALCAPDIYRQPVELVGFSSEQIRRRYVFDEGEIAGLVAVFVQNWRQIVQQPRTKNCNHAGVRIEDRLARPVRTGVTQRD